MSSVDLFDIVKSCDIDALRTYAKSHVLYPIWRHDRNPLHALFLGYLEADIKTQCEFDKDDAMLECCKLLICAGYRPDDCMAFCDNSIYSVLAFAIRAQRWRCVGWMLKQNTAKQLLFYDTPGWVSKCADNSSPCDMCKSSVKDSLRNGHQYCFDVNALRKNRVAAAAADYRDYAAEMNYLHLAVQSARPHFLKALIKNGVPLDGKNAAGHTPLSLVFALFTESQAELFKECARILLAHGAKLEHVKMTIPRWALDMAREMSIPIPSQLPVNEPTTTPPSANVVSCETKSPDPAESNVIAASKEPEVVAFVEPGPDKTLHARGKAELLRHWFTTLDGSIHDAAFVHHHDVVGQKIRGEGLRKHIAKSYREVGYNATSTNGGDDGSVEISFFSTF